MIDMRARAPDYCSAPCDLNYSKSKHKSECGACSLARLPRLLFSFFFDRGIVPTKDVELMDEKV